MSEEKKSKLKELEWRLLRRADIVIVVSENLLETKGKYNKNIFLVSNGVDYKAYRLAMDLAQPPPVDISTLPRPVVGYTGLISDRLDFGIIENIATQKTEWSIVLIGTISEGCLADIERLKKLKNIHFLGMKDISQVPYYVKKFDVCFIPYGKNEQVNNLSPLKLYDFMATGKPIVSTDFPAAQEYKDIIYISKKRQNFISLIEQGLAEKDGIACKKRMKTAEQNTWWHRVNEVSHIINIRLAQIGN